jgi:hypothetical protein
MIRLQAFLAAVSLFTASLHAEVTLYRDGVLRTTLVVPANEVSVAQKPLSELDKDSINVCLAAAEIAHYLERITGSKPQIISDTTAAPKDHALICIGPVRQSAELLQSHPLQPEEYLIRTRGDVIHIAGGDIAENGASTKGSLFAAYEFIESALGVRWFFPGEHGEVVPQRQTLVIGDLDLRGQPAIQKRKIRNQALTREDAFAPVLEKWGVSMEAWKSSHAGDAAWFRRMRLGQRIEIEGGHSFEGYWSKLGAEHPDWFALQPDGTRTQKPPRERLCKSNPALWDYIAQQRIAEFQANPAMLTASIAPNDGGGNKFCMCEQCRALDPPEAPKRIDDSSLIDPDTKLPFSEYPALTDRVFTFFNEIAKRVHAEVPGRSLVAYAYHNYRTPPVRLEALESNLIVGYVGLDLEAIEAWSKIAPKLYIRPNDLGPAIDLGMPRNHAAHLAEAVKFCVEHHAIGFDFDNCHGNWSGHGLDYYILTKALWNPDLDVRAAIADYCSAAYGPGAEAMLRYHELLEKISDQVRADKELDVKSPTVVRLRLHYSDEALTALETELSAARQAVPVSEIAIQARIGMAADSVRYARAVTALLAIAKDKTSPDYAGRLGTVESLLKEKLLTPELASLHSHRYLRMALAYAEREVE